MYISERIKWEVGGERRNGEQKKKVYHVYKAKHTLTANLFEGQKYDYYRILIFMIILGFVLISSVGVQKMGVHIRNSFTHVFSCECG